jgi:hypothetical protein
MTIVIAIFSGVFGLMVGGTLGILVGAALGARRREELEETIAWYERALDNPTTTGVATELQRRRRGSGMPSQPGR